MVADDVAGRLRYALGSAEVTGEDIASATAAFQGQWTVFVQLDPVGADLFDAFAVANFGRQVAVVIDGEVISAPTLNATEFDGGLIISGNFDEADARSLASDLLVDGKRLEFRPVLLMVANDEQGRADLEAFLDTLAP